MTDTKKSADNVWSPEERAVMKEAARERKVQARRGADRAAGEKDLLAKVAEMPDADRVMGEKIHAIVKSVAPELMPKTWYGMPAYANSAGKIVCFFKPASKFNERYSTIGLEAGANVAEGSMWPVAWNVLELSKDDEAFLARLVKKAIS